MHVLTATSKTQGQRSSDFTCAIEGELVWADFVCSADRDDRDPDSGCGCSRTFIGLSSHGATTTAEVRDLPLSRDDVVEAMVGYHESAGHGPVPRREVQREVDDVLAVMVEMPEGTILERRVNQVGP